MTHLERVRIGKSPEVEAREEILARLPVLLLLHVVTVQVLSKLVKDVGSKVKGKHHVDPLGLEVVGRQLRVCLVTGSGPNVGDGERDWVRRLTRDAVSTSCEDRKKDQGMSCTLKLIAFKVFIIPG